MIILNHKQCLHTHTKYVDGKDSIEELIIEAINRKLDGIGFSEHTYIEYSSFPHQLTINDMPNYKNEIHSLKEIYRNQIDIFCGLEYEFYSDIPTDGFDYMIGSIHYLNINGKIVTFDKGLKETLEYVNEHFNGSGLNFAKKYFETVSLLSKKQKIDIIGHFDLITKNNDVGNIFNTDSKEYLSYGYDAIHSLKNKIPLFEVNTGAISRGYKTTPYPQMEFLKEFKNCGFGAVITSDCHDKNFLDCHYEESRELLLYAGFNSHWILTNNGFKEVKL